MGQMQQNLNEQYEYTKIRSNIWQIAEDKGVYCTLVMGSGMAVLVDTGYGNRSLREFVENHIATPYMVINSHGHPDHIGGNGQFDIVWAAREEWDVIQHFEEKKRTYQRFCRGFRAGRKAFNCRRCIQRGIVAVQLWLFINAESL